MYRVLIADDEPWIVYGISKLVDWESLGFQLVGEAFDGNTAVEMIRKNRPDVVISDIRMPGLDGIELMEEIRKGKLDIEVILVSGYSEFNYAQRALRLGAFDYLLKQIEKEILLDTLKRLKAHLDSRRKALLGSEALLVELFDLLESDANAEVGKFYEKKEKAIYPHYRIVNVIDPSASAIGNVREIIILECLKGFPIRTGLNKMTYLLNYDEGDPISLMELLEDFQNGPMYVGVSSLGISSDSLSGLFHEADVALYTSLFYDEKRLIRYQDSESIAVASGIMLRLELSIREQKPEDLKLCLRELLGAFIYKQPNIEQVADLYNQIVSLIHKYYGREDDFQDIEYATYAQFGKITSYDSPFERLSSVAERDALPDLPIMHEQVKKVLSYIDSQFTEDIMLSTIAKQLNISIGYLSHLIKKETGKTYSEYVATKRIELAKELLSDQALSVQTIVQKVGYKDYFHFNKLFKKQVGLTPSKFRKL